MSRKLLGLELGRRIINSRVAPKTYRTALIMSDAKSNIAGASLTRVVNELHKFADPSLAASWDNVGLLVEPTEPKKVRHILLTNDLTEDVMEEALEFTTDLIITYHPLIFVGMKSVTTRTWKERIVAKCLENKIAVYSPHTTFDSVKGGVNDWLVGAFGSAIDTNTPIEPNKEEPTYGMGRLCTLKESMPIEKAVDLVKERTKLKHVRLARARRSDGSVKKIAFCAGAGATLLNGIPADLYVTGEMLHHDVLDAVHKGTHVILTNHSDSERGYLEHFANTLSGIFDEHVCVRVSKRDADPLTTV